MSLVRAGRERSRTRRWPRVERTLETTPADATHWSLRSMARESGLSHTTVRRIWTAFSVQPTARRSSDPLFVDKVRDIVGLYLSPPDRALVLCVDEKSQIRHSIAHSRSCRCAAFAHTGHGTTWFAALDFALRHRRYRRSPGRLLKPWYATHKTAASSAWHIHLRRTHIRNAQACVTAKPTSGLHPKWTKSADDIRRPFAATQLVNGGAGIGAPTGAVRETRRTSNRAETRMTEKVAAHRADAEVPDATHWSLRSMARESGLSHTTVRRIGPLGDLQALQRSAVRGQGPRSSGCRRHRALVLCVQAPRSHTAGPADAAGHA